MCDVARVQWRWRLGRGHGVERLAVDAVVFLGEVVGPAKGKCRLLETILRACARAARRRGESIDDGGGRAVVVDVVALGQGLALIGTAGAKQALVEHEGGRRHSGCWRGLGGKSGCCMLLCAALLRAVLLLAVYFYGNICL